MKTTQPNTPTQADYRILALIEQMMEVVPKGTALGLCDLISAMLSGYFIESGGAVMPAVETFLRQEVEDEAERAARSRRAAKALTYGSYNLKELIDKLREIVAEEGVWEPIIVQGYRVMPVDGTAYRRAAVKKLESKAYFSDTNRAVPAEPIGMIATAKVNPINIINPDNPCQEAMENLARYIIRAYYGYYSNVFRGKRKKSDQDELTHSILEPAG